MCIRDSLKESSSDQIDADTFLRLLMIQSLLKEFGDEVKNNIDIIIEILTKDTEQVVTEFERCTHIVGPLFIGRLITTFVLNPKMEKIFRRLIQTGDVDIDCIPFREIKLLINKLPKDIVTFNDLLNNNFWGAIPLGWVYSTSNSDASSTDKPDWDCGDPRRKVFLNPPKDKVVPDYADIIYLRRSL